MAAVTPPELGVNRCCYTHRQLWLPLFLGNVVPKAYLRSFGEHALFPGVSGKEKTQQEMLVLGWYEQFTVACRPQQWDLPDGNIKAIFPVCAYHFCGSQVLPLQERYSHCN